MEQLKTFVYKPPSPPKSKLEPEFDLRPLDQRTLYTMNADMNRRGVPGVDGAFAAFEYSVVGWRGLPQEYSQQAKRQVLNAENGSAEWSLWIMTIAGELYRRAVLSEDERKN